MDKIGKYEFVAEPFHCDFSGRLFLGHLGNQMLNAADFHSTDRGFGMKYLMTINRSWVLSRLAIEMTEMPGQHERYSVKRANLLTYSRLTTAPSTTGLLPTRRVPLSRAVG